MSLTNFPHGKEIKSSEDLGAWIRLARKAQGLTLVEAAGLCGVGIRFLSELERGKATAELGLVLRVALLMGLDLKVQPRWLEGPR